MPYLTRTLVAGLSTLYGARGLIIDLPPSIEQSLTCCILRLVHETTDFGATLISSDRFLVSHSIITAIFDQSVTLLGQTRNVPQRCSSQKNG